MYVVHMPLKGRLLQGAQASRKPWQIIAYMGCIIASAVSKVQKAVE